MQPTITTDSDELLENPARPFTAKPRPVPVCSAKMPIPVSALGFVQRVSLIRATN